ncbi:hypothetical protein C6I20_12350 [Aeromicrobium sp. A1-2]|uniref:sensor histidine kinase n=1 Tax=Aeromicrobium sp. A1-2 TaxID=2107713 RepID=UPI000E48AD2B|nr:HAMP domain-containing sensor histidine kinase [Aeromicrobium sp. A1-2]AXT85896.1 hypothetical protein C6I20_12350 [Aeromicrobium sp. A1-2]
MSTPGRSLISRIVWSTLIVTAIAMVAMVGTVLLILAALTRNNIDNRLHDQLSAVSATVTVRGDGTVTALETPNDSIDDTTWIFAADGAVIEGPRVGARLTAIATSLSDVRAETNLNQDEHAFLAAPVTRSGTVRAVVVVEAPLEPYESTRNLTLLGLAALALVVTGGSAALAAWTVRRTLEPVETMAESAEDWSEHDLDSRFETTEVDDEFGHLGRTLNGLLDRVAGALRGEQRLTSELAHELRTPLTAIRGEAELSLMAESDADIRVRLERVVTLVDVMSTTISSLVAIARDDARTSSHTTSDVLVRTVLEHHPHARGISVSTDGITAVDIAVPIDLAARALSPILDNALQHARSRVTIVAETEGRMVRIRISDDGEGLPSGDTESVFLSGRRGPASTGAGLGLALSRRVARTLGGDVHVTSAADPTTFTVTLPVS